MSKQVFDRDVFTGVTEFIGKNDKGQTVIQKNQDVKSIIAENRYELNSHIDNNWKGDMHKVASIPLIVVDMWREELKAKGAHDCDPLSTNNRNFLIAKINSSEWSALRTKQGRV